MSNKRQPGVIPNVPTSVDPSTRQFLEAIRESVQVYQGQRGNPLDKVVTFRDFDDRFGTLKKGLVLDIRREIENPAPSPDIGPPTGFGVVGAFGEILVYWDEVRHGNYSFTEVFRTNAPIDAAGDMVGEFPPFSDTYLVATVRGSRITDFVTPAEGYVYWVRHRNASGSPSPFAGPLFISTTQLPSVLLDQLQDELDNDAFAQRLGDRIEPLFLQPLYDADAALYSALSDANVQLSQADAQLQANLDSAKALLQDQINQQGFSITNIEQVNDSQALALNALTLRATDVENSVIQLDTVTTSHASRLTSIESVNATQGSSITSLQTTTGSHALSISRLGAYDTAAGKYAFIKTLEDVDAGQASRISVLESDNTSNKSRITSVEQVNSTQATKITSLETDNGSNKSRISTLETTTGSHASRLTSVESANTTQNGKIATLETTTAGHATRLGVLEADNGSSKSRLTSLETADATQASRIEQLSFTLDPLPRSPIVSEASWVVGSSGSQPGFSQNGSTSENSIVSGVGPYGSTTKLWKCVAGGDNAGDGGWNGSNFTVDSTKRYRFSVWVKAAANNTGTAYLGCSGTVQRIDGSGTNDTNPYFYSGTLHRSAQYIEKWLLMVGVVHPEGTTTSLNIAGIYDPISGQRIGAGAEFRFVPGDTAIYHRAYQYYAGTTPGSTQYFAHPRVDLMDGSEPSLNDLLRSAPYAAVADESRAYFDEISNTLAAERVLKVDVNGNVAGLGLRADSTGSQINFLADKIRFVNPIDQQQQLALQIQNGQLYFDTAISRNFTVENLTFKRGVGLDLSVISDLQLPFGKIVESNLHPDFLGRLVMIDPGAAPTGGSTNAYRNIASVGTSITSSLLGGGNITKVTVTASSSLTRVFFDSVPGATTPPTVTFRVRRGTSLLNIPAAIVNAIPELTDLGSNTYRLTGTSSVTTDDLGGGKTMTVTDDHLNVQFAFDGGNFTGESTFSVEVVSASGQFNPDGVFRIDVFEPTGSTGGLVVNTAWSAISDKPATATRWPTAAEAGAIANNAGTYSGTLIHNGAAVQEAAIRFNINGINRWQIGREADGNGFRIWHYNSSGSYVRAFSFNGTTGDISAASFTGALNGNASSANQLLYRNLYNSNLDTAAVAGRLEYFEGSLMTGAPNASWHTVISARHNNSSNLHGLQIASEFNTDNLRFRVATGSAYRSWRTVWHDGNLTASAINAASLNGGNTFTGSGSFRAFSIRSTDNSNNWSWFALGGSSDNAGNVWHIATNGAAADIGGAGALHFRGANGSTSSLVIEQSHRVRTRGDLHTGGQLHVAFNTISGHNYAAGSVQLFTSDGSSPSIGWHRSGYTACQLRHDGNGLVLSGVTQSTSANLQVLGDIVTPNSLVLTDSSTRFYRGGGTRIYADAEGAANVAQFTAYGMYLPRSGQTAGLYVESPIEARGGIRIGTSSAGGAIASNGDMNLSGAVIGQRISAGYDSGIAGSVNASDWFRVSGGGGIFFATYGGGLHMTDSTWVRVYNAKKFYVENSSVDALNTSGGVRGYYFGVANTSITSGHGISLYNGAVQGQPTYGLMFAGVGTFGAHGTVTKDWATYLTMNADTARGWIFKAGSGSAGNVASISGGGNMSLNGSLTTGGNITTSGTVTAADLIYSSDSKLKRDQTPIVDALHKVGLLTGKTYYRTDVNQYSAGVIAQDVQRVLPEAVTQDEKGFLAVSPGALIGLLVEAVKELSAKVRRLEALQ